jgi:L-seryl-tRNA(Ser) seleniumtransferase
MSGHDGYRELPSVESVLSSGRLRSVRELAGDATTGLVREALDRARDQISKGHPAPTGSEIEEQVLGLAELLLLPSIRPVINATGIIIHTNLGRAPLSGAAVEAMAAVSRGYSNLEFDLETGERGSRNTHLEAILCTLTGAEAAVAVNNNASALLLALTALAARREVIVSRGQAVEIGGGFRIPDVMRQSGASLVEVGTTNRTYLRDYELAISDATAAIMRVHASNFRIIGFTASPSIREIARVATEHNVLLLDDLGSGCLLDTTQFGLASEPTVQESIRDGADLCFFSADKLLGGPQAGVIAGRAELIDRLRGHPLFRAVRLDKASLAGLHATLLHYLRGNALTEVPVWRMISTPLAEIERRARRWARQTGGRVVEGRSMVGGGSLPEESLPTRLLSLQRKSVTELARQLRLVDLPVIARIERGALLLDPRTVLPHEDKTLIAAVKAVLAD